MPGGDSSIGQQRRALLRARRGSRRFRGQLRCRVRVWSWNLRVRASTSTGFPTVVTGAMVVARRHQRPDVLHPKIPVAPPAPQRTVDHLGLLHPFSSPLPHLSVFPPCEEHTAAPRITHRPHGVPPPMCPTRDARAAGDECGIAPNVRGLMGPGGCIRGWRAAAERDHGAASGAAGTSRRPGRTRSAAMRRHGSTVGTGLGGITERHICDESRPQTDMLLIRPTGS